MSWFFLFFFVSGCCSIIYEIVWLRLAMAQFGVTTALTSIALSAFMAGLGLGSWASGRLLPGFEKRISFPPLRLYALTELLIGASGLLVPIELAWGRNLLARISLTSSLAYYLGCGACLAITLVPWCALMGATIPVAMFAIRKSFLQESQRSFSFLYLANVLGAVAGTIVPLVLIELYGFHGTLGFAVGLNLLLAVSAIALTLRRNPESRESPPTEPSLPTRVPSAAFSTRIPLLLLFSTGLTSMAVEVVWIRQFTPFLGTVVYAFALILGAYLAATFVGSQLYRFWSRTHFAEGRLIWISLGFSILLPLITADPSMHVGPLPVGAWISRLTHVSVTLDVTSRGNLWSKLLRLFVGVCPFSAILGFVTPMLVDRWSGGDPDRAGKAYAVNVLGCILGPLLSGFVLLPWMNERWVLFVFAAPWLLIGMLPHWSSAAGAAIEKMAWQRPIPYALAGTALLLVFTSKGYEDRFSPRIVLRDDTATIVATGQGMGKRLRVNGVGITALDPITKIMAHLSLASLNHAPASALDICFGMGTTYRSLLSWNISATAVELVPSVPKVFWYYHADAPQIVKSPLSHILIDDGRRFLERTSEQFDVINLDPPPPVGAAGSSLLYSSEFYETAKRRLRPEGILEQWLPEDETMGDPIVPASVARALRNSFEYVRVFHSSSPAIGSRLTPTQGLLFLASNAPFEARTPASLAERMPQSAIRDLLEWGPEKSAEKQLSDILDNEVPIETLLARAPQSVALDDDRPVNEYYMLRRVQRSQTWQHLARALGIDNSVASAMTDTSTVR
ncbi:MAG TPA: fused MFS/spermidine synthase [Verrucomicrobiae bacterium]|nr:fused MFS/spermidine synthase [Verrucomicrobiae bacterium]